MIDFSGRKFPVDSMRNIVDFLNYRMIKRLVMKSEFFFFYVLLKMACFLLIVNTINLPMGGFGIKYILAYLCRLQMWQIIFVRLPAVCTFEIQ